MTPRRFSKQRFLTISLEQKVAFLKQPGSYPEETSSVTAISTHMSWVFLTDGFVYKLKKPVNYEYLDYRTLEERGRYCRKELELNQRLASGVYLELVPLTVTAVGKMELGGNGELVEWLVKMKRLPEEIMLDNLIKSGHISFELLHQTALLLADFYSSSHHFKIEPREFLKRISDELDKINNMLLEDDHLPRSLAEEIITLQYNCLEKNTEELRNRAKQKKIVEGHGDLRPEHICLTEKPVIIDRLEFSKKLRTLDPLEELAYLSLECERLKAPEIGQEFLIVYMQQTGDQASPSLWHFYRGYKALLFIYFALRHLQEEEFKSDQVWINKANYYLDVARAEFSWESQIKV